MTEFHIRLSFGILEMTEMYKRVLGEPKMGPVEAA